MSKMREWLSWWSTTLPRSGPRVRVPSRALIKPVSCLLTGFCYVYFAVQVLKDNFKNR